eukprot:UN30535
MPDMPDFLAQRGLKHLDTARGLHKQGPIEIGRAEGFEQAEYDLPELPDFLKVRGLAHASSGKIGQRALGPIEIGRAEDFEAATYEKTDSNRHFLAWKPLYQPKKGTEGPLERKQGPVEIGRNDYDVAEFQYETDEDFFGSKIFI